MATKGKMTIYDEARAVTIANIEEHGDAYLEKSADLVGQVFKSKVMGPRHQGVYSPVLDALNVPVRFEYSESYGYYSAQHNPKSPTSSLRDEHIVISSAFYEILKNPTKYNVNYPVPEVIFVYLHELYHARFKHISKQKFLAEKYPFPMSVYNVIFDIFINTLIKYDTNMTSLVGNNIMNLQTFKYGMRFYESFDEIKEMMPVIAQRLEQYDVASTPEELIALNVLTKQPIEQMSDVELAQLVYKLFKDFLDEYQKSFDEVMQEMSEDGDGSDSGPSKPSDEGEPEQDGGTPQEDEDEQGTPQDEGEGSGAGEDEDEGSGSGQGQGEEDEDGEGDSEGEGSGASSYMEQVNEKFQKKLNEKAKNDPKFAASLKGWMANFSDMPSVQVQTVLTNNAKGGVMTPSEIADMLRAKRSLADAVEKIEEKHAGTVPGFLRSFADIQPKQPSYLSQLQSFGNRHIGDTHKTFSPPNKKLSRGNLLVPSQVGTSLDLAFIIDTSGSMSSDEIVPVLGQVNAVLRKAPSSSKIHVLFNDASFQHEVIRGKNISKFKRILQGGVQGSGGSVFGDVFQHKSLKTVDAIIFLSDFYIYIPDDLKITKPLVCIYTEDHNKNVMEEIMKRSRHSMAVPAGRLD